MSQSMEDRVAKAMAHLKATEEAVAKANAELEQNEATARSADRSVKVTVGSKGDLIGLEFLDGKYKTMAASQLSAAVLEAATQARADMARTVMGVLDPLTKRVTDGSMSERMGVDWDKIFGSLVSENPDAQKPTAMSRLRDEIHEDEEEQGAAPKVRKGKRQTVGE
ncbi:YbaB/EbfC family nucleoid-associated protein [Streptomyces sp. NPDC060022]|uniref:YbaB/EbfC family nucleoid-associated protein n=1 Tax=Streptomyces sp. NPDC060022 TaxID=3347039 RepID=UPI0036A39133